MLLGGSGVDYLYGDAGSDRLIGGPDNDAPVRRAGRRPVRVRGQLGPGQCLGTGHRGLRHARLLGGHRRHDPAFRGGELTAGTGSFTLNKPSWAQTISGFGNISGNFGIDSNTVSVNDRGNVNEVQRIFLADAISGQFTLIVADYPNPTAADPNATISGPTQPVTFVADAKVTATRIKECAQYQARCGGGQGPVKVTPVKSVSAFDVEFLKPAYTNLALMTLDPAPNFTRLVFKAPKVTDAGNHSYDIDLFSATGGSFVVK